jgi:hypothetical protein
VEGRSSSRLKASVILILRFSREVIDATGMYMMCRFEEYLKTGKLNYALTISRPDPNSNPTIVLLLLMSCYDYARSREVAVVA